jgi:hypothetical protein
MTRSDILLLLSSLLCALVGAMSIGIAIRERSRGSAAWVWLLPGVFGVLLVAGCLVRVGVVAT